MELKEKLELQEGLKRDESKFKMHKKVRGMHKLSFSPPPCAAAFTASDTVLGLFERGFSNRFSFHLFSC